MQLHKLNGHVMLETRGKMHQSRALQIGVEIELSFSPYARISNS